MPHRSTLFNLFVLLAILALTLACSGGEKAPVAGGAPAAKAAVPAEVQTAVETYLRDAKGLDPSKMNIALSAFTEKDGGATCEGAITLKEGGGMPAMEYTYTLAKGEAGWSVTASAPKGGAGHAAMPPANEMPSGHPSVEGMNPHAGVPGAPPLESGHGTTPTAPAEEQKK